MPSFVWKCRSHIFEIHDRCLIMGIVNVTPDSFSDGGQFLNKDNAIRQALKLVEEGADILDIGGESSRPGSEPVSIEEELSRVLPVVEVLSKQTKVPLSIDTTKAIVAKACLDAGASIINDITGCRGDSEMMGVIQDYSAGVVVMHMQGTPSTMQINPTYGNVVTEVKDFFEERLATLTKAGISNEQICLDPGLGFGKTLEHNLLLLKYGKEFQKLQRPVLLGISRKGIIGQITGKPRSERVIGSISAVCYGIVQQAVQVVRVHDVAPTREMIQICAAIQQVDRTP
jgi:dihydropteroate synthase